MQNKLALKKTSRDYFTRGNEGITWRKKQVYVSDILQRMVVLDPILTTIKDYNNTLTDKCMYASSSC